jgi:hypothetical protein
MPMTPRGMRRAMLMRPGLDGSTRSCGSVHIAAARSALGEMATNKNPP